jgi:hypothetical protein
VNAAHHHPLIYEGCCIFLVALGGNRNERNPLHLPSNVWTHKAFFFFKRSYVPYCYQENQSVVVLDLNIHKPDASQFIKLDFG